MTSGRVASFLQTRYDVRAEWNWREPRASLDRFTVIEHRGTIESRMAVPRRMPRQRLSSVPASDRMKAREQPPARKRDRMSSRDPALNSVPEHAALAKPRGH